MKWSDVVKAAAEKQAEMDEMMNEAIEDLLEEAEAEEVDEPEAD